MVRITPAILAHDASDLRAKLSHAVCGAAGRVHVDILDGSMFHTSCMHDPSGLEHGDSAGNIELHLMVQNPLPHILAWHKTGLPVAAAIVHAEIARPVARIFQEAKALGMERILALNPETPVEVADEHHERISEVLIMGVSPGASGRAFLGEPILAKMRRIKALHPHLSIACDGGVTADNAAYIVRAGATRLIAASAIWRDHDPVLAHARLSEIANSVKVA